jgi:uncharacterized protein
MSDLDEDSLQHQLARLHARIDARVAALTAIHGARLECKQGCSGCCLDGLTVFPVEADRIRSEAPHILKSPPHPEGACAFLDEAGACRIYEQRPYVCRTQGLPLRWLDEIEGATVELRDICSLNEGAGKPPIETLDPSECWSLGPTEESLAALQQAYGNDGPIRLELRKLFEEPSDSQGAPSENIRS